MRLGIAMMGLVLGVTGCGEDDFNPFESQDGSATAPTTMPATSAGDATATGQVTMTSMGTGAATSMGADSTGDGSAGTTMSVGPKLDVGSEDSTGAAEPCRKVDVILAIDSSTSMDDVVTDLQSTFNGWVGQLLNDVGDNGIEDFQLAVIDGCEGTPYFHDSHDTTGACNFSTGANYMLSDSPTLGAEFTCVSNTRNSNYMSMPDSCSGDEDDEDMAAAAAAAVGFPAGMNQNAGFLRDDAVLFIVVVTNEDEGGSPSFSSAVNIYNSILALKGGEVNNVVFLGVGGESVCFVYGAFTTPAVVLEEIANLFAVDDRGVFSDLCDQDFAGAFTEAIGKVDSACDNFVPPA